MLRVALDPRRDPTLRANAALAVTPELDEEERGRLRSAAAASLSPRLRVALDAAARAEVSDAEELVAAVEEEAHTVKLAVVSPRDVEG
ncbi:MAG: hypothetical protein U0414_44165 [Polyangiaceae bacterium]